MSADQRFWGKYSGSVIDNADPEGLLRVRLLCPQIFGAAESGWAKPSLPPGIVAVPPTGARVWVEFESGDPTMPIWTGIWFDAPP